LLACLLGRVFYVQISTLYFGEGKIQMKKSIIITLLVVILLGAVTVGATTIINYATEAKEQKAELKIAEAMTKIETYAVLTDL